MKEVIFYNKTLVLQGMNHKKFCTQNRQLVMTYGVIRFLIIDIHYLSFYSIITILLVVILDSHPQSSSLYILLIKLPMTIIPYLWNMSSIISS